MRKLTLALWIGLASMAAQPLRAAPVEALKALSAKGAVISARVVDLETGKTLAKMNPAQALIPASVTKLYTAAAALHEWGADWRFTTSVRYSGKIVDGMLHGELVLHGSGDPGLTNAQLWTLAQRVREAGIKRVDGPVVIDISKFGRVPCATASRCQAMNASRAAYNAPLSSAGFDYSNACVWVRPAEVAGIPATVAIEPFDLPMFGLRGRIMTLPADAKARVSVVRITSEGRNWFYIQGGVPANAPARCYYRSVSKPAMFTGQAFIAFLRQAGVKIKHYTARIDKRPPAHTRPLVRVRGISLAEELRGMLIYSNNYMADVLALDLARTTHPAPLTLAQAGTWLTRYARRINASSPWPGARQGKPVLLSGSGLTPGNRVSANDLIALLATEYQDYGDFPAFLGALTVPDQTPVPMLRGGPKSWQTQVYAKTGSLNQPISVFALAGYVRLDNGHWGAFAVLVNGTRKRPDIGLFDSVDKVRAFILSTLRSSKGE